MIRVSNLSLSFDNEIIIDNVSFGLNAGEKMVITGKSGCGKSTLLHALLGFVKPLRGVIRIDNKKLSSGNISRIRQITSYMPQENAFPIASVRTLIHSALKWTNKTSVPAMHDKINAYLQQWDLPLSILDKELNQISGGQKQRILLMSVLLSQKQILFLDEPTSSLDQHLAEKIKHHVMNETEKTAIIATHDPTWMELADKHLILK